MNRQLVRTRISFVCASYKLDVITMFSLRYWSSQNRFRCPSPTLPEPMHATPGGLSFVEGGGKFGWEEGMSFVNLCSQPHEAP